MVTPGATEPVPGVPGRVVMRGRRALRRGRRALGRVSRVVPGARPAANLARAVPTVRLLRRSGLFDQEYYEAQRGTRFRGEWAAVLDFIRHARTQWPAPNPLFEGQWLVPQHKRGTLKPLLRYLRGADVRRGPSPIFDDAGYLAANPDAATHPGRALGHFLSRAGEQAVIPVPEGFRGEPPRWGAFRARMLELARRQARFVELAAEPTARGRDTRAETAFRRSLPAATPAPAAGPPLVSVVMLLHPPAAGAAAALAALRAQTLQSWELLVVVAPDGAEQNGAEQDGAEQDGAEQNGAEQQEPVTPAELGMPAARTRVLRVTGSPATARNAGLAAATGRYVAFLDAGSAWEPDFLQTMTTFLSAGGHRAAHSVAEVIQGGQRRYLAGEGGLERLEVRNHVALPSLVAEAALLAELGGFDESLLRWEEHDLALRIEQVSPIAPAPFLGCRAVGGAAPDRAADTPAVNGDLATTDHWQWVVLGKHHVRWAEVEAGLAERVPGRVTISMPTFQDWRMTVRAVTAVLTSSDGHDVEIVVVDNGSGRSVSAILSAAFFSEPRVRLVSLPRNLNFAIASNLGMAVGTGDRVVFLNNDTEVLPGWLDPMLAELEDPAVRGAQPLLLFPDGTIQSAGSLLPGGDAPPMVFLAGHPPEDALRAAPIRLRIVTAAALAVRAAEFTALCGFDPIFVNGQEDVDYCLRAEERFGGRFAVATGATVFHYEQSTPGRGARIQPNRMLLVQRWRGRLEATDLDAYERAGLRLDRLEPGEKGGHGQVRIPRPVVTRPARQVTQGPAAGLPALRWAIKLAAHPGPRGDGWGDVHFAAALVRALERLGQEVVVDRRESRTRDTAAIDDVALVIRGLEEVPALPGQLNLLWVISHPDLVTEAELSAFDAVFAASEPWAARMTASGHPVTPLLQATDPEHFNPGLAVPGGDDEVVFVGRSRNVLRPIVRDAVEAGVDLVLYGDGWEQFGLADKVRATYLPNSELGRTYASAGVVLNDHWTDMAAEGFISNRVFDAVACGARVVSDPVAGLEELFGGMVHTYRSAQEFARLCGPEGRHSFPDDETRRALAKRVGAEHSFDARARALLDAVLALRSVTVAG